MAGFEAVIHSIISGVFAASAGAAGKLAFDKALISNGCLELRSVFESSELLNWLQTLEFYRNVILHTDVCNNQVGTLLFPCHVSHYTAYIKRGIIDLVSILTKYMLYTNV